MKPKIRILHLEDDPRDAELIASEFEAHGLSADIVLAKTREEFIEALNREGSSFALILADFTIPSYDGFSALRNAKEKCPDTPLIFVSGTIGEERAIESLKSGASDYVLKNNLRRLIPVVEHVLKEEAEVSLRKRAEAALRLHSAVINTMGEGVIVTKVGDGTIVYTNPRFEEMFGYGPGELIGKNIAIVNAPTDKSPDEIAKDIQQYLLTHGIWSGEVYNIRKDGTPFWCHATVSTLEGTEYGKVWVSVHTDITERKRAEREAAIVAEIGRVIGSTLNIEEIYSRVAAETFKLIPYDRLMVALKKIGTDEFEVAHVSGMETPKRKVGDSEPLHGTTLAVVMKTRTGMLVQPDDPEEIKDSYPNLYSNYKLGLRSTLTVPLISANEVIGSLNFRSKKLKAYTDHDLRLAEGIGMQIAKAITNARLFADLEKNVKALRESQEELSITQFSVDFAAESIAWIGKDGRYLRVNDSFCDLLGFSRDEVRCLRLYDVNPKMTAESWPGYWREIVQHGSRILEEERRKKDGTLIPVEVISKYLRYGDSEFIVSFTRDISERKQYEKRLKQRFDRLTALRAIDMAITASLDVRVTLNVFLDQVVSTLGVDAADILLLNSGGYNKLSFVAGRGFQTKALQYTKLSFGEGIAGRIAHERMSVCICDLEKEASDFLEKSKFLRKEKFVAYFGTPLIAKGQVKGVLEVFNRAPLDPDQEWLDFLEALATQAAIAVDNASLFDNLQKSNIDLIQTYDNTLEGWSRALDLRDKETEGHSERVVEMTLNISERMGLRGDELVHARRGALLHDIGKMGIPDHILLKPGALDDEERAIINRHPDYAYSFLSPIGYLKPALDIPYCHHENWDGTGYPRGLKGDQIPLAARIFAVADVWDALRSDRPYRSAWTVEKARHYITEQAGKKFDPQVVEAFFNVMATEE